MASKSRIWLARIPPMWQEDEPIWQMLISELERERLMRYQSVQARRGFLYNHLLLRHVRLELCGDVAHEGGCLRYDGLGRPVLQCGTGGYEISLSRCHDMVACAVSEAGCRVGVDIESVQRGDLDVDAMARVVMQPREWDEWSNHGECRQRSFLSNWCGKEAYAKALGTGLLRCPMEYALRLPRHTPSGARVFTICDPMLPASREWSTRLSMVGEQHIISCVCECGEIETPRFVLPEQLAARCLSGVHCNANNSHLH